MVAGGEEAKPVDERDDAADVLESGTKPARPGAWSRLAAVAIALVVGVAAGAGGMAWYTAAKTERAEKRAIELDAREDGGIAIVDPNDRCATATVQLQNIGTYPVTVERLYADLTGRGSDQNVPACDLQESTPHPITITPKATQAWTIVFRLECGQSWGTPTYRATVITASGDRREVSAPIERPEPVATYSCDGDPDVTWDNVGRAVVGTGPHASLVVTGMIRTSTGRIELLSMRLADGSGFDLQLEPFDSMPVTAEPRAVRARVRVVDCAAAERLPDTSVELRIRARLGRALVVVPFDEPRNVTRSLVRLVDAACGV